MHQDINTFSEVLDIDTQDRLQVRLVIVPHGNIHYRMRLNGHLIAELDTTHTFDLLSSVHLKCRVIDANNGAVEIKLLSINGTEVLPKYQHLAQPPTAWIIRKVHGSLISTAHFIRGSMQFPDRVGLHNIDI